jgi:hypothetical protein
MFPKVPRSMLISDFQDLQKHMGIPTLGETAQALFALISEGARSETLPEIQSSLKTVNKVLDSVTLHYPDDYFPADSGLSGACNSVKRAYQAYMSSLFSVIDSATNTSVSNSHRSSLTELGHWISVNIHATLANLDKYLVKEPFDSTSGRNALQLMCVTGMSKNPDLLAHFIAIKSFVIRYQAIQARGMVLMTLASNDPTVKYSGVASHLTTVRDRMKLQSTVHFRRPFGMSRSLVAQSLLKNPGGIEIEIKYGPRSLKMHAEDQRLTTVENKSGSTFILSCREDVEDPDELKEYTFCIESEFSENGYLVASPVEYRVKGDSTPMNSCWKIIPSGKDWCRIQYKSVMPEFSEVDGWFLKASEDTPFLQLDTFEELEEQQYQFHIHLQR